MLSAGGRAIIWHLSCLLQLTQVPLIGGNSTRFPIGRNYVNTITRHSCPLIMEESGELWGSAEFATDNPTHFITKP